MVVCRICKSAFPFRFNAMISLINQAVVCLPVVPSQKPLLLEHPFAISFKFRSFGSTSSSSRVAHQSKLLLTNAFYSSSPAVAISSRVSRTVKSEAERLLFEYLHSTRGFHFTDADHISKNAPYFLHKLLSRFDSDNDTCRELSRFFRYNPINEFEPFFESLGLTPDEFSPFLPRGLMYLRDDHVLLENYHVLCEYGIPRAKMGRMYKEAKEIFSYGNGALVLKLLAYEQLGLSRSTLIKLVSCNPAFLIGGIDCAFVSVIEKLNLLGFENDWIGGYLSSNLTYNWRRMHDTIIFLDSMGYSKENMGTMFQKNPGVLFEGSGKTVYVAVGRLHKVGVKVDAIVSLFSQDPELLSRRCVKNLWQGLSFMLDIGMEMKDIASIVSTHGKLLSLSTLKGPRTVLRSLKVGKDSLCEMIKEDPLKLFHLASKSKGDSLLMPCQNPSKNLEKTEFLLKLGYLENSDEMIKALKKFRGRGDLLQERFDCLVKAGLDCNVVSDMIKQVPSVLNLSKDVIEKKIDCLVNCLGYPLDTVAAFPAYLCYDLKRINLRFSMYVWLRERGAAKTTLSLSTILACSDTRFLKYLVDVHPGGRAMWDSLKKSSLSG